MGQCSSGRAQVPTQLSSPPRVLVFRNMLCMAEIRSLSWMWKTWNCGWGRGEGRTEGSQRHLGVHHWAPNTACDNICP